jgi:hypothetical protein
MDVTYTYGSARAVSRLQCSIISVPVLSGCHFCSRYADRLIVVPPERSSLSRTVKEQLCIMAYVVNSTGLMDEWNFYLSSVSVCKLSRRVDSGGVRLFRNVGTCLLDHTMSVPRR